MKKYLAPEFEEVKYDVEDCLEASGDASNWPDDDDPFGAINELP